MHVGGGGGGGGRMNIMQLLSHTLHLQKINTLQIPHSDLQVHIPTSFSAFHNVISTALQL